MFLIFLFLKPTFSSKKLLPNDLTSFSLNIAVRFRDSVESDSGFVDVCSSLSAVLSMSSFTTASGGLSSFPFNVHELQGGNKQNTIIQTINVTMMKISLYGNVLFSSFVTGKQNKFYFVINPWYD